MTTQAQDDIYRAAFEAANTELIEISEQFDRLRSRMEQVERLVTALKPLVLENESGTENQTAKSSPEPVLAGPEAQKESAAEPANIASDPFQRRVSNMLGIGGGIRDVKSYTRQF
jgi:hypothetical protein